MFSYRLSVGSHFTTVTLDNFGCGACTMEMDGAVYERSMLNLGPQEATRLESLLRSVDLAPFAHGQAHSGLTITLDGMQYAVSMYAAPEGLRPFLDEMRTLISRELSESAGRPNASAHVDLPPRALDEEEVRPVGWVWPLLGGLTIQAVSYVIASIAVMLLPAFTSGLSVLLFFIAAVVIELGVSYFLIPLMIALFTDARRVDRAVRACYAALAMDLVWNAVWTWGLPERPAGLLIAVGLAYAGAKLGARWAKEEEAPPAPLAPTSPQTMW